MNSHLSSAPELERHQMSMTFDPGRHYYCRISPLVKTENYTVQVKVMGWITFQKTGKWHYIPGSVCDAIHKTAHNGKHFDELRLLGMFNARRMFDFAADAEEIAYVEDLYRRMVETETPGSAARPKYLGSIVDNITPEDLHRLKTAHMAKGVVGDFAVGPAPAAEAAATAPRPEQDRVSASPAPAPAVQPEAPKPAPEPVLEADPANEKKTASSRPSRPKKPE